MSEPIPRSDPTAVPRAAAVDRIRALLRQGAPWAACDAYRAAADGSADDPELVYWGALACARSGATREARALIDRIGRSADAPADIRRETLCLSGRLWKDRIDRSDATGVCGVDAMRLARDDYLAAHAVDGAAYPAVNAATLSMLLGDDASAATLARDVLRRLAASSAPLDAWDAATKGEALLLLADVDGARRCYEAAAARTRDDAGAIASMRGQLRRLERAVPAARDVLGVLPAPAVLAFAGHMIDAPGRVEPRFPPSMEGAVAADLRERLASAHRPIVYTSAACGADLLFIEAAFDVDAEVNVVLPFDRDDFVATSVAFAGDRWVERFDRALAGATRVIQATDERHLGDDVLFAHAQHLVAGLAVLRASQLHVVPSMLCVMDRRAADAVGGTRGACDRWAATGRPLDRIALDATVDDDASPAVVPPSSVSRVATTPDRPPRSLKVTLFADIAGFGALHDQTVPLFRARFLGIVADRIAALKSPPLEANTWGDAIYVVFDDVEDGAAFATGLVERIDAVDWTTTGLADTSHIRIALHAGPVFCDFDPIVRRVSHFGTSVTKTARIEPITPPGLVYASEAFVATLAVRPANDYVFEYVGDVALAKNYGTSRIYRLERR